MIRGNLLMIMKINQFEYVGNKIFNDYLIFLGI